MIEAPKAPMAVMRRLSLQEAIMRHEAELMSEDKMYNCVMDEESDIDAGYESRPMSRVYQGRSASECLE